MESTNHNSSTAPTVYWRVEGSLLDLTVVEPVAFFTWNAQTFAERFRRRGQIFLMALLRPFLYSTNRKFATRAVHTVLRGVTRDRLDLLGEEFFLYKLKPRLKERGVRKVQELVEAGAEVVLVSQGLDHVMRPLAQHLGVKRIVANRLEFRDGMATGRLIEPVIRPRGAFARIREENPDGRRAPKTLARQLDISVEELRAAVIPAERRPFAPTRPIVNFEGQRQAPGFSVRRAFSGKQVMLIGVTGFIGKVWLANTLLDLPEVKKIYLLIRRQKSNPAERRFEKMVEDSPVFDPLFDRHGDRLLDFLHGKIEVVEGDVTQPGLGLSAETARRLQKNLDLIINSSGLTDFNPDLRDALTTNTDAAVNILEFVRSADHAGLLHLSTCYVAGEQDGRVSEKLTPNYNPRAMAGVRCRTGMALAPGIREAGRGAGRERGSHLGLADAGAIQGACGKESARRGAREPDPQEPRPLAEDLSDRGGNAPRQGTGLAEYLYAYQEPGRVADRETRRRTADRDSASRDRGDFGCQAVPRME